MLTFTIPMCLILLVTSQCIIAYPTNSETIALSSSNTMKQRRFDNLRLKRNLGLFQQHEIANHFNDELPANFDELFVIVPRPNNHKRLIDF
mgnify:FL=1